MLLGLTPVERVFGGRIHNTVFRFDWNRRSVMFRAGVWDVQDRVAEPLIRVLSSLFAHTVAILKHLYNHSQRRLNIVVYDFPGYTVFLFHPLLRCRHCHLVGSNGINHCFLGDFSSLHSRCPTLSRTHPPSRILPQGMSHTLVDVEVSNSVFL